MLKIRMQRVGRKHEPVFRLVLTESKNGPKSGKFLEILGSYDSRRGEKAEVNSERVSYWLSKGVQVSDTAHNVLLQKGVVKGEKRNVLPKGVIEQAKQKGKEEVKEAVIETKAPEPETTPTQTQVEPESQPEEVAEEKVEKVEEQAVEETASQ